MFKKNQQKSNKSFQPGVDSRALEIVSEAYRNVEKMPDKSLFTDMKEL